MRQVKIRKIDNSLGIILPREILTRLHGEDGDAVFLMETPDGGSILTF